MKKKIKINKNSGVVFWITGLPGSGKTSIGKLIKRKISRIYGPTILLNGDDLRNVFDLRGYDRKYRINLAKSYTKLIKNLSNQKINVIFTTVALFHEVRKFNRKTLSNYVEIFFKSNVKAIIKKKFKKNVYKNKKNVWGMSLKPEFPIRPNIVIRNNSKKPLKKLSKELVEKIKKII